MHKNKGTVLVKNIKQEEDEKGNNAPLPSKSEVSTAKEKEALLKNSLDSIHNEAGEGRPAKTLRC